MEKYDLIVIGSGPAGQRAAIQAAKFGKHVALVEKLEVVGGVAINTGTIPSKTIREAVLHLSGFYYQNIYGVNYRVKEQITMADLSFRAQHVIKTEIDVIRAQLSRNGIEIFTGTASFLDPCHIRVVGSRNQSEYEAANTGADVGIALGARAGNLHDHSRRAACRLRAVRAGGHRRPRAAPVGSRQRMTLLRLDNVGKSYGGVAALRGVSFAVGAGEIIGLMGANGAGKTTAFSLIAGTQRPTSGEIWFDGARIDRKPPYAVAHLGIARTFQIVRPFGGLRVIDNLVVAAMYGHARERTRSAAEDRAREILHEVGLARDLERRAETLTLAGRKRLEIARALATSPRLLLLDEVLAGLTASEVAEALDIIRALHRQRNLTLVVIEHVMRALTQLCQRIVVLHHGEKIAEGSPAEITADPRVIACYLGTRKA